VTVRNYVLAGLDRVRVLGPAFRLWERLRALGAGGSDDGTDGLPLPPARLRLLVAGTADADWFVRSGRATADVIRAAASQQGFELAKIGRLLDFGCGCGRVLRHWRDLDISVHGSDYNRELVRWCERNLRFATFTRNGLAPPLELDDASVDVAYAVSVLTHLPEDLQQGWLAELRRVVRPGGLLILTTHGDRYRDHLDTEERARYDRGDLVVRWASVAGTNLCTAFHPKQYVRDRLVTGFELREFVEEGIAEGTPHHDLIVAGRP
jgi:SAM-dependent methyltransferase